LKAPNLESASGNSSGAEGILIPGKAQEKAAVFRTQKRTDPTPDSMAAGVQKLSHNDGSANHVSTFGRSVRF
jgi:hypothetical protein